MVLWSIDSLFYSIHRWCLFLLSLSLQVAWSSTAATYTDSWLFSHLCPLLSSTTNCPPASNTALHAGNQTKNLKTSHPTQNSYCCVSRGESATKQMNPLTNDASLKYTVTKLDISVLSISSQSSVFNHMHRSRRLTSVPSRSHACPLSMDPYIL